MRQAARRPKALRTAPVALAAVALAASACTASAPPPRSVAAIHLGAGIPVQAAGSAPADQATAARPARPAGAANSAQSNAALRTAAASRQAAEPEARMKARELAAAVLFGCVDSRNTAAQRTMSRAGVAGIVLLGASPPADLRSRLRSVRAAAPKGRAPVIASDEEGGTVQRLAPLIYPLPSAETMGTWRNRTIRRTAKEYGKRMRGLGIGVSLAPVADLRVPGSYVDRLGRAFSSDPNKVRRKVRAWSRGLRTAGVIPVVKHWPGHGHAADTHTQAARVPPFRQLRRADLVPFRGYIGAGHRAVMVAHVQSAGLTKPGVPATQSRRAINRLRKQAGPDAVIVTDSLSMAAASSARGLTPSQAVVAALRAGVDWAMVCTAEIRPTISAVARAMRSGRLDRRQLEESAARIRSLRP